jgi:uncharacterized delta-60 repeat protein
MNLQLSFFRLFKLLLPGFLGAMLTLISFATVSASGPGDLDTTFNHTGVVTTTLDGKNIQGTSVAIQPDGKILVAGNSKYPEKQNFVLARYQPDGQMDTTFNFTGMVTAPLGNGYLFGSDVAIQSDGKIIVAGTDDFQSGKFQIAAVRYEPNGSLDPIFGNGGVLTTSILKSNGNDFGNAVALQPDDKILIAGRLYTESVVLRYTVTGTLDSTFNGNGIVTNAIGQLSEGFDLIATNNKIVMVGVLEESESNFLITRHDMNGNLDSSFNGSGIVTTSIKAGTDDLGFISVAIQPDNKIVAVGESSDANNSPVIALMRYNDNGSLDTDFNETGIVTTSVGSGIAGADVALQSDGKIVVVGTCVEAGKIKFAIIRYNSDGSLDSDFGNGGVVTSLFEASGNTGRAVAIQNDGKIVAAGFGKTMTVARYLDQSYPDFYYFPVIFKSASSHHSQVVIELPPKENYQVNQIIPFTITVANNLGLDRFEWGVFKEISPIGVGGTQNCFGATECEITASFSPPVTGNYQIGVVALDMIGNSSVQSRSLVVQ